MSRDAYAAAMGDKPQKYWDYRECRWVSCPQPAEEAVVPAQERPAPGDEAATAVENAH